MTDVLPFSLPIHCKFFKHPSTGAEVMTWHSEIFLEEKHEIDDGLLY
jgi:hypothetical protein